MLESINVENNKLTSLKTIEQLPNLKSVNAQNNQIQKLHDGMLDMFCLDSINLVGNPIVMQHASLAQIYED